MDIFILELVSNRLTVPVKIDGRQEQEETSELLKSGDQCIHVCTGVAKLGVVVFYEDTPPNCNVQSVLTAPVRIDGRYQ